METLKRAIFLDRDGTIIVDKCYLSDPMGIEYFPWTREALQRLTQLGFQLFIVSNQSGIGRGMFSFEDATRVNAQIEADLREWKTPILETAFCPHAPEANCSCRKPNPTMILDLAKKYGIDCSQSYMIGDKIDDALAGQNAGMTGVIVGAKRDSRFAGYNTLLDFAKELV